MIITTPDRLHYGPAMAALETRLHWLKWVLETENMRDMVTSYTPAQVWASYAVINGEAMLSTTPLTVTITSQVPWGKCLTGVGMGNVQPLQRRLADHGDRRLVPSRRRCRAGAGQTKER